MQAFFSGLFLVIKASLLVIYTNLVFYIFFHNFVDFMQKFEAYSALLFWSLILSPFAVIISGIFVTINLITQIKRPKFYFKNLIRESWQWISIFIISGFAAYMSINVP